MKIQLENIHDTSTVCASLDNPEGVQIERNLVVSYIDPSRGKYTDIEIRLFIPDEEEVRNEEEARSNPTDQNILSFRRKKPSDFIKRGWTRDALAKNAWGQPVNATNPRAVSWTIEGALRAAYPMDAEKQKAARDKIKAAICERSGLLIAYNDVSWMSAEHIIDLLQEAGE